MVVGEIAEPVDLLVVGGGPGGYAAALRASQLGRRVTLVERGGPEALGGICLHVGCIPSKALIEVASAKASIERFAAAGLTAGDLGLDLTVFQGWKRGISSKLATGIGGLLAAAGVDVVHGEMSFSTADRASVRTPDGGVKFFEFKQAILATGSRPASLPGLAFDGEQVLDSTDALALESLPERLAVVGAGYIGLEIGAALAKLGSEVVVLEALDRILPGIDPALAAPVAKRLAEQGVTVELSTRVLGFEAGTLRAERGGDELEFAVEKVIVAVGRVPNTDELGLGAAGIEPAGDGKVSVGLDMRATPTIAAIGDIVPGPQLAHRAIREGVVAAEALCGLPAAFDAVATPEVVFTDPEIASVGLTEAQARAEGLNVKTGSFPFSASGRAATLSAQQGSVRLVVDVDRDCVVGVHMVGPHVSELAGEAALAVEMAASPEDLAGTIHPHPTISEGLGEVAELFLGRPIHVPAQRKAAS